jgi:2-C-methyl-D-erythritol 4-phosphate cytidylyltransferase
LILQSKPLFLYAVEEFEAIPWISHIIIAADNITRVENILGQRTESSGKITVTQGGNTRHRSIQAGLIALQSKYTTFTVVVERQNMYSINRGLAYCKTCYLSAKMIAETKIKRDGL